jgi:hypothetical protein
MDRTVEQLAEDVFKNAENGLPQKRELMNRKERKEHKGQIGLTLQRTRADRDPIVSLRSLRSLWLNFFFQDYHEPS